MSYLERVQALHDWRPGEFVPFVVDQRRLGWVRRDRLGLLAEFPDVFHVDEDAVTLASSAQTVEARSAAVHEAMAVLADRGDIRPLRGELFPVAEAWRAPLRLTLDRGIVPFFGVKAYGVHVNGYRIESGGMQVWIGTRSPTKRVAPGKLDHLVAGGLGVGYSIGETLVKEAAEEADIGPELAASARPVGALSYRCEGEGGLRSDTLFLFDLAMPADVVPRNTDGELTGFELWRVENAMARVRDSDDFKFNVAPVMIDFFLRHGLLNPDDEPHYLEIVEALQRGASD